MTESKRVSAAKNIAATATVAIAMAIAGSTAHAATGTDAATAKVDVKTETAVQAAVTPNTPKLKNRQIVVESADEAKKAGAKKAAPQKAETKKLVTNKDGTTTKVVKETVVISKTPPKNLKDEKIVIIEDKTKAAPAPKAAATPKAAPVPKAKPKMTKKQRTKIRRARLSKRYQRYLDDHYDAYDHDDDRYYEAPRYRSYNYYEAPRRNFSGYRSNRYYYRQDYNRGYSRY